MTKITQAQRSGFVRMLNELKEKAENNAVSRYYDNPARDAERERLRKKYRLNELEQAKERAYETYRQADRKVDEGLKKFTEAAAQTQQKKIEHLMLAIRDIWGCDELEKVSGIVARFIKEDISA